MAVSTIKSFSVGNGDMFYIYHGTDNFTIIDCCYKDDESFESNIDEIKELACKKGIVRFISTHPDEDHIHGIEKLFKSLSIPNFYVVKNEATKEIETDSFSYYCKLRDSNKAYYVHKGCSRKWMNESDSERGSSGINFLWPNINNDEFKKALIKVKKGEQYNNISPIFTYSLTNGVKIMWMGDIETDFLDKVKDEINWPEIDILFAPHHGRDSGKPSNDILEKLNPKLIVIGEADSEHLNYYSGYSTITQNSAKDILFNCDTGIVDIYVGSSTYNTNIKDMKHKHKEPLNGLYYLGTLEL